MEKYDVIIIGSGPGGYIGAIRCAQLGLKTACIEKMETLGGTCLNIGCIPSKALLESSERFVAAQHSAAEHGIRLGSVELDLPTMHARREGIVDKLTGGVGMLFQKNKIDHLRGHGRLKGREDGLYRLVVRGEGGAESEVLAESVILATGSEPVSLKGCDFDYERIVDSTGALEFPEVPEHLILVGAGVIGLELGSVWKRLGAKVTVLEYLDRILPGMDSEIAKEAHKSFIKQGLEFNLGARVQSAVREGDSVTVTWEDKDGKAHSLKADRVLIAVGRRPYTEGLGLEEAGVEVDERGRIVIDSEFQTSAPGIFAVGDVVRGAMLAHKAEEEGIAVAEILAGERAHINYDAIPSVVYTHPEVASVGKTEEELKEAGVPYVKGRFRFGANGRAMALGESEGLVKILAHAETDRILGAHIFGARAGDLIAELAAAINFGASSEDVARTCHAHPTLAEVVWEAALDCSKRALHK